MKEAFEKIRQMLENEVKYQNIHADIAKDICELEEISVFMARTKMAECYGHAIEIVNAVEGWYNNEQCV